jgi:hypothetical protein
MENSINKALTEEDRVAAVILAIQGHSVDKKQVVVVEGDDDEVFYERFLDMSNCDIIVNNSCCGYEAISSTCNAKGYANRYFMIKDSDFDRLLGKASVDNQMLTDFHDRELFLSELDVDALLGSRYGVAIDVKSIAMAIRGLSVTKWFNMANDCKLAFKKKCVVPKVYDGQSDVSVDDCVVQLANEKKNVGKHIPDKAQVAGFIVSTEGVDWRQYTNGHDWLQAIAMWLNVRLNKALSYKIDIRPYLESVYSEDDFKGTELYAEIRKREDIISKNLLKAAA